MVFVKLSILSSFSTARVGTLSAHLRIFYKFLKNKFIITTPPTLPQMRYKLFEWKIKKYEQSLFKISHKTGGMWCVDREGRVNLRRWLLDLPLVADVRFWSRFSRLSCQGSQINTAFFIMAAPSSHSPWRPPIPIPRRSRSVQHLSLVPSHRFGPNNDSITGN